MIDQTTPKCSATPWIAVFLCGHGVLAAPEARAQAPDCTVNVQSPLHSQVLETAKQWAGEGSPSRALTRELRQQYQRYLSDTLTSLEKMRAPNGLVVDKVKFTDGHYQTLNANTSPTNIGLDLLIQLQLLQDPATDSAIRAKAEKNLTQVVSTLSALPRHPDSGLFYSWYEAQSGTPKQKNVSSVDNIHLALALWAIGKTLPQSPAGKSAAVLFQKMDFTPFLDTKTGLMGGNLQHQSREGKETWFREPWNYSNYGSEARSVYSLTHALGLLRSAPENFPFSEQASKNVKIEIAKTPEGKILRTWDGGTFQLFLPDLLAHESLYSPNLGATLQNYSTHALAESDRNRIAVPSTFSAANLAVDDDAQAFPKIPAYAGQVGNPSLVSEDHNEFKDAENRKNWDRAATPHAMFLAATQDPVRYAESLKRAETQGTQQKLYQPGWGWMDAIHVRHEHQGKVVPVQLSLDQSMLALATMKILSADGHTLSSRLLNADPTAHSRLQNFYSRIDQRL